MWKHLLRLMIVVALANTMAWADDFWDKKDFLEWDNRELVKMTTDSPWAKRISVKVGRDSRFDFDATHTATSGVSASGLDRARSSGLGKRGGARSLTIPVVVSWQSALPIKQAMVKFQLRTGESASEEQQAFLDRKEEYYALVLGSIPPQIAEGFNGIEDVKENVFLKRKNKENIYPQEIEVQARAGEVVFLFPRSSKIELNDKDVELNVELDGFKFKKKFKLKDMVVNGKLEL